LGKDSCKWAPAAVLRHVVPQESRCTRRLVGPLKPAGNTSTQPSRISVRFVPPPFHRAGQVGAAATASPLPRLRVCGHVLPSLVHTAAVRRCPCGPRGGGRRRCSIRSTTQRRVVAGASGSTAARQQLQQHRSATRVQHPGPVERGAGPGSGARRGCGQRRRWGRWPAASTGDCVGAGRVHGSVAAHSQAVAGGRVGVGGVGGLEGGGHARVVSVKLAGL
jgi:hypothetical protein